MERDELRAIPRLLPGGRLFSNVLIEDRVDSTNTRLKLLAFQGAPEGTVLLAEEQTGGRGTRGRSFHSPRGEGLYLSVLLRPDCGVEELLTLTGRAAVAARRGVERASGAPVEIKWLNDLSLHGRKLCGILTELSLKPDGSPDYVVVGIGINVSQTAETFRAQGLESTAISLAMAGYRTARSRLCACVLEELEKMYREFPAQRERWLAQYRASCLTLGRRVSFEEGERTLLGRALEIDRSFALVLRGEDGLVRTVSSGTVTPLPG